MAGKREGLAGERSGLFMEQIRIVKEMREHDATSNKHRGVSVRPRYMVWENVTGALSSGNPKGEDFRIVLEEICRICDEDASIPRPPKGKWMPSGCIMGDGWSVAWRVHDAQFWGVPQRRKRISLVADFGGESAPEILFERKGLSGDSSEVEGSGQVVTTDSRTGSDLAISFQERAGKPGGVRESSSNMNESEHCPPSTTSTCVVLEGNGSRPSHHGDGYSESEVMYTLNGTEQHSVCTEQRESLCVGNGQMHQVHLQDKVGALNTMHDQQMILDVPKCYGLDRASFNQGKNALYDFAVEEEIAQPLVARGPGGVMTELSVHSAPEITKE